MARPSERDPAVLGAGPPLLAAILASTAVLVACTEKSEPPSQGTAVQGSSAAPAPIADAAGPSARETTPDSSAAAAPSSSSSPSTAGSEPAGKADKLVILAGGDVNLGRSCGQRILKDPSYNPFSELGPLFSSADLRFVNLESQLSDQGGETQSRINRLIFTGPPGGADVLKNAGIDLVSLANNHAWDYGKKAFLETLSNLEHAGVPFVGASRERGRQYEPTILSVKGWRIAWFAVCLLYTSPSPRDS